MARQNDLIIYSDEIYDRLVMDGLVHVPIATLAPDLFVVTLNGLSKSHRVAGFRCGWMVLSGDKSRVKGYIEGLNMLASMRLCSNVLSQQIIQTALGGYQSVDGLLLPGGRIYEQREFIYNAINDIPGLSAVKPKAAFYIFPKIDTAKFDIYDDEKFVLDFLHKHHILLVHGGGFNWQQPDHFRIVYLPKMEDLKLQQIKCVNFKYLQTKIKNYQKIASNEAIFGSSCFINNTILRFHMLFTNNHSVGIFFFHIRTRICYYDEIRIFILLLHKA